MERKRKGVMGPVKVG